MNPYDQFERTKCEPREIEQYSRILSLPILTSSSAYGIITPLANYMKVPECVPERIVISKYQSKSYGVCKYCYYRTQFEITLYPNGRNLGTLLHEWTHGLLLHKSEETRTPNYRKVNGEHCQAFSRYFLESVESFVEMVTTT